MKKNTRNDKGKKTAKKTFRKDLNKEQDFAKEGYLWKKRLQ